MTTDPTSTSLGGANYRGFAVSPPEGAREGGLTPPRRRGLDAPRAAIVGGGVLAALALGLGLGFATKPELATAPTLAPMQPVAGGQPLSVQVNPPTSPAPVKPAGKLEVLPPDMAQAAAQRASQAPAQPPVQAQVQATTYSAPPATLRWSVPAPPLPVRAPQVVTAPIVAPPVAPASAGPARFTSLASGCSAAPSRAAQMVCADPELAAADRELNRAWRRALRSGAPVDQLRQDQRDWLAIREDAARRSPRALANVYDQRIDELNQIADDGDG
jgi:uncharacterized protein YecT (DUF1311 family)